jgi:hypothetical protein
VCKMEQLAACTLTPVAALSQMRRLLRAWLLRSLTRFRVFSAATRYVGRSGTIEGQVFARFFIFSYVCVYILNIYTCMYTYIYGAAIKRAADENEATDMAVRHITGGRIVRQAAA